MTATNELRRMLTDAGVNYTDVDEYTMYWDGTLDGTKWGLWRAFEYDGLLHLMFSDDVDFVIPQEAIVATVGCGTCHIEERHGDWYCTGCGEMVGTCDTASELFIDGNAVSLWKFCPNCGRKVVDDA